MKNFLHVLGKYLEYTCYAIAIILGIPFVLFVLYMLYAQIATYF